MDLKVGRLGVIISPGGKVIVSLAWSSVHLDLNATHGLTSRNASMWWQSCVRGDIHRNVNLLRVHRECQQRCPGLVPVFCFQFLVWREQSQARGLVWALWHTLAPPPAGTLGRLRQQPRHRPGRCTPSCWWWVLWETEYYVRWSWSLILAMSGSQHMCSGSGGGAAMHSVSGAQGPLSGLWSAPSTLAPTDTTNCIHKTMFMSTTRKFREIVRLVDWHWLWTWPNDDWWTNVVIIWYLFLNKSKVYYSWVTVHEWLVTMCQCHNYTIHNWHNIIEMVWEVTQEIIHVPNNPICVKVEGIKVWANTPFTSCVLRHLSLSINPGYLLFFILWRLKINPISKVYYFTFSSGHYHGYEDNSIGLGPAPE